MSIVPITSGTSNYSMTPVPVRPEWIELVKPAADLANQIANTDFVPAEFRNKPEAIAACILFGSELGLGPMVSLSKIDIVKGRPAPRAEIARALALAAGHDLWVDETTNTRVKVSGKRRGSNHVMTVTWTMDDAKKAGIAGNPTYAKYPRQMLLARASAELVRQVCPEVLGGITVFAEEAADIDDRDTPAVTPTPPAAATDSPPGTRKRSRAAKPATEPETAPDEPTAADAQIDESKPSAAQTKMVMAAFTEQGMGGEDNRDDRLAATGAFIGRLVGSWSELSKDEASRVIDGLDRLKAGDIEFHIDDDGVWSVSATAYGDDAA